MDFGAGREGEEELLNIIEESRRTREVGDDWCGVSVFSKHRVIYRRVWL
jgi:hypothetical protein